MEGLFVASHDFVGDGLEKNRIFFVHLDEGNRLAVSIGEGRPKR